MPLSDDDPSHNLDALREAVLIKRPILREVLEHRGSKSLFDYAQEYIDVYVNHPIQSRQNEFIHEFQLQVARLLGNEVATSAANQLKRYYFVSTTEHHGPVCHPFFVNSSLATILPYAETADPILQNVIVLSCSSVSLNNSAYSKGLFFHSTKNDTTEIQRLPFFSSKFGQRPVYRFPAFTKEHVAKLQQEISTLQQTKKIQASAADQLHAVYEDIYSQPKVLDCRYYSDQITLTNNQLWQKFFHKTDYTPPRLIYLAVEELVTQLLIKYHFYRDTIMHHLLFNSDYNSGIDTYFEGIMGAFSKKDQIGTEWFWAIPPGQKYRVQLWKQGDYLTTPDNSYSVKLQPDTLQAALEAKEIMPNMMLCYMLLSFYYGVKCLGGFNQINYLTQMKNAYIKMNADHGNYKSIEVCARAQTKEMNDGLSLAFLETPNHELQLASGLDLVLYGKDKLWSIIQHEAKYITLNEALTPIMPELYKVVYNKTERDTAFNTITDKVIIQLIGLDKKIQPCATIC